MCAEIYYALKGVIMDTLITQDMYHESLQDILFNIFILKHLDLWRPMVKIRIPHTLIDLGPLIVDFILKYN